MQEDDKRQDPETCEACGGREHGRTSFALGVAEGAKRAALWKRAAKHYREAAKDWEHIARLKDNNSDEVLRAVLEEISQCNGGAGHMPELARKALEK